MKRAVVLFGLVMLAYLPALAQTPVPAPSPSPTPDVNAEKARADRLQARLLDFANYARFREANSKLPPPAKDEKRVVFMGDSITDFWKLDEFFPGRAFVNRGISGQTTPQMLIRFRPDVIELKPQVVVILAGTNDISNYNADPQVAPTIEANLTSMVELAHANGIKVVIASVLPVSDYNNDKTNQPIIRTVLRPPARILELNAWIKRYCAEKGLGSIWIIFPRRSMSTDCSGPTWQTTVFIRMRRAMRR
ncbi:MAG: GDSL-type esterase/lipase family protein [Pyrinomonadaceae bacterium]